jgi:sigma-B regulation protein RsbU (phosphoserine phosphatase)
MKALGDCRVLLVDDAKANLDILVEGLRGEYKLSLALGGEMALALAARTPPDLVLLDIMMPGIDGYEVCRRLRAQPETADVPIIFLSSLEDVQHKSRGFEAGANDYVTKPFDLLEVKARVRAQLKAKAYSDAMKELLAADLRVARAIQMGMIPQDFSALEAEFGVELAGVMEPAREVGGDLYSAFPVGGGRLLVLVGDVSGKGIPASLFMVRASSLVRLLGRNCAEPDIILAQLNDELSADNPSVMFVTMVCAVYEPATGRVVLASAGHNRPVLLRKGRAPDWAFAKSGTALGFEPGLVFPRTELVLQPGDSLVLYTDGVNEAFDENEACFGNQRMLDALAPLAGAAATQATQGLLQAVRDYVGDAAQSDDIAILVLRPGMTVAAGAAPPADVRMTLNAVPADVMHAVGQLQALGREQGIDEKALFGLAVALEEFASNIVNHAYSGRPHEQFEVAFAWSDGALAIELRDRGDAFDPTAAEPPRADAGEELRGEGGWGILMARHYLDEMTYAREGDQNVLTLGKRFGAAPASET